MKSADEMNDDEGTLKKISMLGDLAVGKTSLVNRYVFNVFGDEYISTIGTKVVKKKLTHNNRKIVLMIWDIAGETTFNHIRKAYFRGSEAGLVVVDITRKKTLDNVSDWISSFLEITGDSPILILVNKSDLKEDYTFTMDSAHEIAEKFQTKALSTSAKTGENVEEAFHILTELIFSRSENPDI
ncbi:MAG: GTP-binding protein [Methanomassiliicoccales archaeon]|nr:MAG: GTP-binding protein [Methanomassiliicoccales archaeon]